MLHFIFYIFSEIIAFSKFLASGISLLMCILAHPEWIVLLAILWLVIECQELSYRFSFTIVHILTFCFSYHEFHELQVKTAKEYPSFIAEEVKTYEESMCEYFKATRITQKKVEEQGHIPEGTCVLVAFR